MEDKEQQVPAEDQQKRIRINQHDLEKLYKYYSCTSLKNVYDNDDNDSESPVANDIQPIQQSTNQIDVEMTDLSLFSSRFKKQQNTGSEGTVISSKLIQQKEKKRIQKLKKKQQSQGIKCKEIAVIYKKVSGKMGVRKFRVLKSGDLDCINTPDILSEMRTKFGKLLVFHADFSEEFFLQCGGFFNRKFWDINLRWGLGASHEENLQRIDHYLDTYNKLHQ